MTLKLLVGVICGRGRALLYCCIAFDFDHTSYYYCCNTCTLRYVAAVVYGESPPPSLHFRVEGAIN